MTLREKLSQLEVMHLAPSVVFAEHGNSDEIQLSGKLLADPIKSVYLVCMGIEDESVSILKEVLALSMGVVKKYI